MTSFKAKDEFQRLMLLDDNQAEKTLQASIAWETKQATHGLYQQSEALLKQADFSGSVDDKLLHYLNDEYLVHTLTTMTLGLKKMDSDQLVANVENFQARLKHLSQVKAVSEANKIWAKELIDFSANKLKNFNL